jgi:HEAT repeat protein
MIQDCLTIIRSGDIDRLFEIIPRIGVLRDPRFREVLLDTLSQPDVKRKEFAAYAMGAMAERGFLEPLKKTFAETQQQKGFGVDELQIAIIEAIGAIGDDAAVDFFLPILKSTRGSKNAGRLPAWIVESLGAIAQQGGVKSLEALVELARYPDPEIQASALSELSVAFWHRPNEVDGSILQLMYELTKDSNAMVAESALAALQSLADVGCCKAEELFSVQGNK